MFQISTEKGTIKRRYSYFSKGYMNSKYSILKTIEPNDEDEENPLKINSIYNTCVLETRQRGTQMWEKKMKTKYEAL